MPLTTGLAASCFYSYSLHKDLYVRHLEERENRDANEGMTVAYSCYKISDNKN